MNVQTLITESLRLIGVAASGETPANADLTDGMAALNAMIAEWSADQLLISAQSTATITLTGLKYVYTIGAGGDFNIPQPDAITGAVLTDVNGNYQFPPLALVTRDTWNTFTDVLVAQGAPTALFYARGTTQQAIPASAGTGCTVNVTAPEGVVTALAVNAGGSTYLAGDIIQVVGGNSDCYFKVLTVNSGAVLTIQIIQAGTGYSTANGAATTPSVIPFSGGTISLYPAPDTARTYSLKIDYDAPFTQFVALTDVVTFPNSDHKVLKYNLAMEMAAEYGLTPLPTVSVIAENSLRKIRARNIRMVPAAVGMGTAHGRSDFYSGEI
ncbi:MAG: hypothetical protein KGI71_03815 [Patescibacteria group bacterium]|nr:hypothetical protein [Patescibacteria group bacterium]